MKLKQLALKKGMREPNAKHNVFFNTDRVQCQIATTKKEKEIVMGDWIGNLESKEYIHIFFYIFFSTKLRRLCKIDFISVSRKHNNTRYQLAVPLASLNKDRQPNGEIKTIFHLVRIIFEAHYWKKWRGSWCFYFYKWIKNSHHQFRRGSLTEEGIKTSTEIGGLNISNTFWKDQIAGSQPWLNNGTTWGASQNPEAWVSLLCILMNSI